MARITKEERAAQRAKYEEDERIRLEKFKADLPERLFRLVELATTEGVYVTVSLTDAGPKVMFDNSDTENDFYLSDTLLYNSEEHEVEHVEYVVSRIKSVRETKALNKKLAQEAFDKLSVDEKKLVKQYVSYLT